MPIDTSMSTDETSVLITGALGQDGRLLAGRLACEGRRVFGLVRPERAGTEPAPCPLLGIDLTDAEAVMEVVRRLRPARIFHIAAAHHSSEVPLTATPTLWRAMTAVNHAATTVLIQAILAHAPECRLVFAATSQMYRPGEGDRVITEDSPRDPPTWYGLTKAWSVDAIRFARTRFGLHGSSAILFNHESPHRPESFVSRKISKAAARIRLGLETRLELRDIGARADWFSAEDAVDAMIRMAEAPAADDYVVGSGRASSVRDLLEAAFSAVGLDWRDHVEARADTARPTLIADPSRLRQALGWAPGRDIRAEMARMTESDLADPGLRPA